ncbi:MAG: 3-hydroxyisobutyryl-CoA hydrolase [Micavibrio sp.]|nr:3-hydroxyisobutyryl-CoA hydrolase [Micavibrio sp.]
MDSHLIIEHRGPFGLITLNRPEALNALTLGMIRGIREVLAVWKDDPAIRAVIFLGAGDRAFCAGGDVKKVYEAGIGIDDPVRKTALARVYFAEEYRMNRELFHYPKPTIAFMNGIVMGGGFGVAGACKTRVATEKTRFAMPEVGIGFFPDVGSVYTLSRCPRKTGYWLGLTGATIGAADMLPLGIATHYMSEGQFAAALEQMIEVEDPEFLDTLSGLPSDAEAKLMPQLDLIEKSFSASSVEKIIESLHQDGGGFAMETADILATRSPISLKVTLAYLDKMQGASFDTVTAMDYRLAIGFMSGKEFYEGIRAALIDRDKAPRWQPRQLSEVEGGVIENYFAGDLPDLDHSD